MKTEIWKDVIGYEGVLKVSNLGTIKRLAYISDKTNKFYKEKILKQSRTGKCFKKGKGYFVVRFGKLLKDHRLVAEAFIDNKYNLEQVNHKDKNSLNNHYSNLEWVSNFENTRHRYLDRTNYS